MEPVVVLIALVLHLCSDLCSCYLDILLLFLFLPFLIEVVRHWIETGVVTGKYQSLQLVKVDC